MVMPWTVCIRAAVRCAAGCQGTSVPVQAHALLQQGLSAWPVEVAHGLPGRVRQYDDAVQRAPQHGPQVRVAQRQGWCS